MTENPLDINALKKRIATYNHRHPDKKIHMPNVIRGVDWRSESTDLSQNIEYQWIWKSKAKKWVRLHNYAIPNAEHRYMMDLYRLDKEYAPDDTGDYSDDANRAYKHCEDFIQNVKRTNQEANAWLHENYNGADFYVTDTEKAPNYTQYLAKQSDDQLKKSLKYWQSEEKSKQVEKVPIGGGKTQKVTFNIGDAVNIHHETHYNDPNNLVNRLVNGVRSMDHAYNSKTLTKESLYDADDNITNQQMSILNDYGKRFNDAISTQENLRAKMNEATKRRQYNQLNSQYQRAKLNTRYIGTQWRTYVNQFHNKHISKDLNKFLTSGVRQLNHIYYLDHTYYDRDQWRLAAIQRYLPQRRQNEINASIREQVQNNMQNNLVSIFRKDKKDDTVIGFAENTPNETLDMNLSTSPVDSGMPQTNFAQVNSRQLTDAGTLYDRPLAFAPMVDDSKAKAMTRGQEYLTLMHWEDHSVPVVIIGGFSWWRSCLIQSLTKAPEPTATDNGLNIQFTMPYIRLAYIKWGKQAKGGKAKGRNNASTKTHIVKSGQTLSGIAHDNRTTLRAIAKANPKIRNLNYIVPGEKVAIPK